MAEGVLDVIGFFSGIFGIVSSIQSWLPKAGPQTTVRIYAGLQTNAADSTGGNVPGVALWDAVGGLVGFEDGTKNTIHSGKFYDIQVASDGIPAEYIAISNGGNDGICISSVAITQVDGTQPSGWYGDIGRSCGAPWYHQQAVLGTGSNGDYRPSCVWLDRDRSNENAYQGMSFHLIDFGNKGLVKQFNQRNDTLCHSLPRFTMWQNFTTQDTIMIYEDPPESNEDGTDIDINAILNPKLKQADPIVFNNAAGLPSGATATYLPIPMKAPNWQDHNPAKKRKQRRQVNQAYQNQLVVSNIDSHSAQELCESDTSSGPDFVSTSEGLFCDMSEKQLWPLCSGVVTASCFDTTTNTIRGTTSSSSIGNVTIVPRQTQADSAVSDKSYTYIHNWT